MSLRSKIVGALPAKALELLGAVDYHLRPSVRRGNWGTPLNGQQARAELVIALLALGADFVVETGTFRGASTAFFAQHARCPVISTEIEPRSFGFARERLRRLQNVTLVRGDSRATLRRLGLRGELRDQRPFVYLDAHWGEDLPLAEELELVLRHWPKAIVMVDDFAVPDDPGYGYDDYGPGRALTLDYATEVLARHGVGVFFPRTAAADESGARRGCLVAVADPGRAAEVAALPGLRAYPTTWR